MSDIDEIIKAVLSGNVEGIALTMEQIDRAVDEIDSEQTAQFISNLPPNLRQDYMNHIVTSTTKAIIAIGSEYYKRTGRFFYYDTDMEHPA